MYREALALSIHRDRPDIEVVIAPAGTLDGETDGFEPHMMIRNDTDGADVSLREGVLCWIEILYSDGLNARISLDGKVWEIEDISIEDMVRLVGETEKMVPDQSAE